MSDYLVVTTRRVADLQDRVRSLLEEGYRPQGGIAMLDSDEIGEDEPHMVFAQALMREDRSESS